MRLSALIGQWLVLSEPSEAEGRGRNDSLEGGLSWGRPQRLQRFSDVEDWYFAAAGVGFQSRWARNHPCEQFPGVILSMLGVRGFHVPWWLTSFCCVVFDVGIPKPRRRGWWPPPAPLSHRRGLEANTEMGRLLPGPDFPVAGSRAHRDRLPNTSCWPQRRFWRQEDKMELGKGGCGENTLCC